MAKKNISELSSDELYRLAQEREQQEAAEAKEAARAQIEELRTARRECTGRSQQPRQKACILPRECHWPGARYRQPGQKDLYQGDKGRTRKPWRSGQQPTPDTRLPEKAGQGDLSCQVDLFTGITVTTSALPDSL